jgi:hypothetical protein
MLPAPAWTTAELPDRAFDAASAVGVTAANETRATDAAAINRMSLNAALRAAKANMSRNYPFWRSRNTLYGQVDGIRI